MSTSIESTLVETRVFPPPAEFAKQANVSGAAGYQALLEEADRQHALVTGEQVHTMPELYANRSRMSSCARGKGASAIRCFSSRARPPDAPSAAASGLPPCCRKAAGPVAPPL